MTPFLMIIINIVIFNVGFIFGAYWHSICKRNKDFDMADSPSITKRCNRCGQLFDVTLTDDPESIICHTCMEALKNDPRDPYWEVKNNQ